MFDVKDCFVHWWTISVFNEKRKKLEIVQINSIQFDSSEEYLF